MSKPKKGGKGFSIPTATSKDKPQTSKISNSLKATEQQAIRLVNEGKLKDAQNIYLKLIEDGNSNISILINLASIYGIQGRLDEVIELLNQVLVANPNDPDAHYNIGNAFQEKGNLDTAISHYYEVLKLTPNDPDAHYTLANALQEKEDLSSAISHYNTVLELTPRDTDACINLGNALRQNGDLEEAISFYNKAIELRPNNPEALNNLGNALKDQGKVNTANSCFNKAINLKPNYYDAHKNLSITELLCGNYKNGLERYEQRFKCIQNECLLHAKPACKEWNGENIKQTKQLLMVSEQGLGDTLQFMRYVIALRQQGANVSICAQEKLHTLIKASGIDQSPLKSQQACNISRGEWIPLLSVPRYLDVSPDNPIIAEPYIKTTNELVTKWNNILSAEQRPIIGLNWQGNPEAEKTGLHGRSLPLEAFAPIAEHTSASLLSLQKGFGSEQLQTCSFKQRFVKCQHQVDKTWDFLETAAIIANCDLVITSDTAVAHLAGGMGKATWLLLKKVPDWRWGLFGNTTFWYPSMRLFRQQERNDWHEVLQRVTEALQDEFSNTREHQEPIKEQSSNKPITTDMQPTNKCQNEISAPISLGELIDKITILQIKTHHLNGQALANVENELKALQKTLNDLDLDIDLSLMQRLKQVNQDLWNIEDSIREKEYEKDFGETFIQLARSVYRQNDRRAALKKQINITYGSSLTEEKAYKNY